MPSEAMHRAAAQRNEDLAARLADDAPEWAVVLAFYAALHWVDAYFARQGQHPRTHIERVRWIQQEGALLPLYDPYRTLRDRADAARYHLTPFSSGEVRALLTGELYAVRVHITRLLDG
jgi:hypothetical protein